MIESVTSVELALQAINNRLANQETRMSNQDTMLLEIKVQTTKHNGRMTRIETIIWGTGLVLLTVAVLKGGALLNVLKLLFI